MAPGRIHQTLAREWGQRYGGRGVEGLRRPFPCPHSLACALAPARLGCCRRAYGWWCHRTWGQADSPADPNGIIDDIEHFKKVTFDYQGDQHRPNYLKIAWGSLLFKGVLSSLDINFKLFRADGTPLRATASLSVTGFVEDNLRVALENNQSPDLTHFREVKHGDTLPLMTNRIYGDSKYYLEVAKANMIYDFRGLKVGTQIYFPPIEKLSK